MAERLKDKVAMVSGGAGGLGLSICLDYAKEGAKIVIVGRSQEKLDAGKAQLQAVGAECVVVAANLSTSDGCADAMTKAQAAFGSVDVLVNCTGVFIWKKFLDLSDADWEATIGSNLSAAFYATQAFAQCVTAQERQGSVINVSSIHGMVGDGSVVPHCASKFGLLGLTQASAEALRPMGIRVNSISPGAIEPNSSEKSSDSLKDKVTQAEVAKLATFLASNESGNLTGTNLNAFGITRPVIASK